MNVSLADDVGASNLWHSTECPTMVADSEVENFADFFKIQDFAV